MFLDIRILKTMFLLFLFIIIILNMKNQLFTLIVSLFLATITWGQDSVSYKQSVPQLVSESISLIQFNTVRDPANVGIQGRNFSIITLANLSKTPFNEVHNQISGESYFGKKQTIGIGVYYTLDNWSNRLFNNSLGFAFKKKINHFHIGLGIEKNTIYIDSNNLVFGDMIDPRKGIIYPTSDMSIEYSKSYLNFRPSIIYNTEKIKIGVSLSNITEPNNSLINGDSQISIETNLNASYLFPFKQKWCYTPMVQLNYTKTNQQLEIHNIITFSDLRKTHFLDLSYTLQKQVSIQYGINFNNRFKFHGQLNTPTYYASYFQLSILAGIQYSIKPKK